MNTTEKQTASVRIEEKNDPQLGRMILLSDAVAEVGVALDYGIRVAHFNCKNMPSLFYRQPEDRMDGLTTPNGWRIYGGHRFWASPESEKSYYPDNQPVSYELLPDGIHLRQSIDPWTDFEKQLTIRLLGGGEISAEHILINRGQCTVQAAAWGVTTLCGGGTAQIPFPLGNAGEYVPGRVVSLWGETSLADPRLHFQKDAIRAEHLTAGNPLKIGIYSACGMLSAENLGQRLTIRCDIHPIEACADRGCNVELYLDNHVMELETLGVLARLEPGEHTSHKEYWKIEPIRCV